MFKHAQKSHVFQDYNIFSIKIPYQLRYMYGKVKSSTPVHIFQNPTLILEPFRGTLEISENLIKCFSSYFLDLSRWIHQYDSPKSLGLSIILDPHPFKMRQQQHSQRVWDWILPPPLRNSCIHLYVAFVVQEKCCFSDAVVENSSPIPLEISVSLGEATIVLFLL